MRSDVVKRGVERAPHRSLLRALGCTDHEMAQPFIGCALRLRDEIGDPQDIVRIEAQVGEGTVHRLWEPRLEKAEPSTPYSAKFSVPFSVSGSPPRLRLEAPNVALVSRPAARSERS